MQHYNMEKFAEIENTSECLICFDQTKLQPVCYTINCDGYRIGLCETCIDIQNINGKIVCPMCRQEFVFEKCELCIII